MISHDTSIDHQELDKVIVSIDPATWSGETGMIIAGVKHLNDSESICYILDDLTCEPEPSIWGPIAAKAFEEWGADEIVYERNQGGAMVEHVLETYGVDPGYVQDLQSQTSKANRAEPVAALYDSGQVVHAKAFEELESQMCSWVPTERRRSPDRMDAMVHAVTHLIIDQSGTFDMYW